MTVLSWVPIVRVTLLPPEGETFVEILKMDKTARVNTQSVTPAAAPRAVTVLIARRVLPDHVASFEAAMQGMLAAAEHFQGHLGGQVVPPEDVEEGASHCCTTSSSLSTAKSIWRPGSPRQSVRTGWSKCCRTPWARSNYSV